MLQGTLYVVICVDAPLTRVAVSPRVGRAGPRWPADRRDPGFLPEPRAPMGRWARVRTALGGAGPPARAPGAGRPWCP